MPSTRARLSVVVPCYRAEAYLRQCLDSVLSHNGGDLEVIAVDDGSPDGIPALLDEYAGRDPRLRVLHLPTNRGPGPARNVGLEHATADYVWFVDSDDWLPPGAPQAVIDRLAVSQPDTLIVDHAEVFGALAVRRRTAELMSGLPTPVHLAQRPQLLRLAQSACTKIVRRTLLDDVGLAFPPGRYEDALFSPALLMAAERIDVLDRVCYCYRQGTPGSTTSSAGAWHFEVFDQYARLFARVDQAAGRLDGFRPELLRVMVDHYLVILGHRSRLPAGLRRAFFRRMVSDYARWLPAGGYSRPRGVSGIKHCLVRRDAYRAYAALRWVFRILPRRSPVRRGR